MSASTAALSTFARALNQLADVPSRAATDAAEGIQRLIDAEFTEGHDPYGNPWAALEQATLDKGRSPPPLTDSGALAGGTEVTPMRGKGLQIVVGESYGAFHQVGTRHMVARPILPTSGLPAEWKGAIDDAMTRAFAKSLGGGRR